MDLSSKKLANVVRSMLFLSLCYTFIIGDKKFSTSTLGQFSLLLCVILLFSTIYLDWQQDKKATAKIVFVMALLACISSVYVVFLFR